MRIASVRQMNWVLILSSSQQKHCKSLLTGSRTRWVVGQDVPAKMFGGPLTPTSSHNLLHQKQLLRGDKVSRLQPVEVHPTREIRTVKLDLVNSRVPLLIHQHGHFAS